jgi:hypothetical protein
MSKQMQLGKGARGWEHRSEHKRRGRKAERRRIQQLATRELQLETSPRRRYRFWY